MDNEKEITLLMYESNSVFGKWRAILAESSGMDSEAYVLEGLAGHGDTPLEAAASLLAMAAGECERRQYSVQSVGDNALNPTIGGQAHKPVV